MSNDTRLVCGWVGGRICHLPPGHAGEDHWTVEGGMAEALEVQALEAQVDDELSAEWVLWQRLREGMGADFAADLETNVGRRAAGDFAPLLAGLRAILGTLDAIAADRAASVVRTIAAELVEQYDPSFGR